jgi:hypothetical protein
MRRLAFVRLFFQMGIDQSQQPDPLNVASVLTLHDTAELFLQLVAEHRHVNLPRFVHFHEYWRKLDPHGIALTGERPMSRLNDLRTAFKHHGTMPSDTAIQQACIDVRAFLEANTPSVFGAAFDSIGMAEVIPQPSIRDKVRSASPVAAGGDVTEGMGLLSDAHDDLFGITTDPQPGRPAARFGNTIRTMAEYDIASVLRPSPDDHSRRSASADYHNLATVISDTASASGHMQRALRVMALDIDYRQYERFNKLTPAIAYYMNGRSERRSPPGYVPTMDEFEFCRPFIITAALRITERP